MAERQARMRLSVGRNALLRLRDRRHHQRRTRCGRRNRVPLPGGRQRIENCRESSRAAPGISRLVAPPNC